MQGLKINECGDQIVPIPIQRNNCIESVRLRKEILVNSAKMQESVQPLLSSDRPAIDQAAYELELSLLWISVC